MSAGVLYTFIGSGNSYKVRLLEAFLGISLEHKELDFLVRLSWSVRLKLTRGQADDQHAPEFLKINPRGEVPTVVVGDKVFTDSSSILTWLAGNHGHDGQPGPSSFWSSDLYEQAQIIDWVSKVAGQYTHLSDPL